jgi:lysozyme family protein
MSAATATFDEAFALLLQLEGNIAGMLDQPFYDSWRRSQGLPPRPVVQATLAEAQEFIYDNYWRPLSCGVMPRAWALMVLCEAPN